MTHKPKAPSPKTYNLNSHAIIPLCHTQPINPAPESPESQALTSHAITPLSNSQWMTPSCPCPTPRPASGSRPHEAGWCAHEWSHQVYVPYEAGWACRVEWSNQGSMGGTIQRRMRGEDGWSQGGRALVEWREGGRALVEWRSLTDGVWVEEHSMTDGARVGERSLSGTWSGSIGMGPSLLEPVWVHRS